MSTHDSYHPRHITLFHQHIASWCLCCLFLLLGTTTMAQTYITSLSQITNMRGNYKLSGNITATTGVSGTFTGTFDGGMYTISGLTGPLFETVNGATIRNVMLDNVQISGHSGNTGAIAGTANGASRIYNCGVLNTNTTETNNFRSNISGTGYTGSIVGRLNGTSRVINCFSYATITGGTTVGGIVGYNSVAPTLGSYYTTKTKVNHWHYYSGYYPEEPITETFTTTTQTAASIKTLIVNCMFYGNITGGDIAYPIYGGSKISNHSNAGNISTSNTGDQRIGTDENGRTIYSKTYTTTNTWRNAINNYNYFRQEATMTNLQSDYNCALAAEERFLRRWEFYRGILNSNRELMAYYISGSTADTHLVAKWVQADGYLYPILKKWGRYSSQNNSPYVLDHTARPAKTYDYSINYNIDYNDPDAVSALEDKLDTHFCGAGLGTLSVTVNRGSYGSGNRQTITLPITDMDTHTLQNRYDYCFRKVQLPYYNDLFEGNYGARVVTGWKITSVTGNSTNTYRAEDSDLGYNFADTLDAGKDIYNTSGRVFAQGGYYYVPQGVTAITIEAYWGNAVYVSDPTYDVIYNENYFANNFTLAGNRPTTFNGQTVHTSLDIAVNAVPAGATVYDNAIVLVGNVHYHAGGAMPAYAGAAKPFYNDALRPFTIMSIDRDKDNEPDYCLYYQHKDRQETNPIRFDFLWQPGIGIAAKVDGDSKMPDVGIFYPKGHFEITETALAHYYEFEYDYNGKASSPLILNNGIFEQFVSTQYGADKHTKYILLGGHIWMKEFNNGIHNNGSTFTPHVPISVMGGEYPKFYLSGIFRPDATATADNAECYINGGKFGEIAGAGQEQINGNVTFKINHALIDEFYGGGINKQKPVTGDINVIINHSVVGKYCGAAKFGNMVTNKTVTTNAYGTVFGTYYGAGNGGTSIYRQNTQDVSNLTGNDGTTFVGWTAGYTPGTYDSGKGIATGYEYEYFVWAGSSSNQKVGRFYVHYSSFDVAQTNNVSSTLTNCFIQGNYYGGGNLGAVNGTATSSLNNTIVRGDAYGGGFSADIPIADVYSAPPTSYPTFDANTGLFKAAVLPTPTKYTWSNQGSYSPALMTIDGKNLIHTDSDLSSLGKVLQDAKITVKGNSRIYGSLYGGGAKSNVEGNTAVNVMGNAKIDKNVYGGGNAGLVGGSTHVQVGGQEWQQTTTQP